MSFALLSCLLIGIPVELTTTDGQTSTGDLVSLSTDEIRFQADGATASTTFPAKVIQSVHLTSNDASVLREPEILANMTDGSVLAATAVTSDGKVLSFQSVPEKSVRVPRGLVRSVRLRTFPDNSTAERWNELLGESVEADQVAILRNSRPLQTVEGVLGELDGDTLKFNFDGDWIDVKRERVAGLIFYTPSSENGLVSRCQVTTLRGSRLDVHSIALNEDGFRITTAAGVTSAWPVAAIQQINFASTNIVYLSDLEPESWTFRPGLGIPGLDELQKDWFRPRRDTTLGGRILTSIHGDEPREHLKGLGLHSRTELTYRLAGEYRRFTAIASLDPSPHRGAISVEVLADERIVATYPIASNQAVDIDVSVIGAKRMSVRVTPGDDSDQGDHLNLCDARLIK